METKTKTMGKTIKQVKAIGINLLYEEQGLTSQANGFEILYENGETKQFALSYMDRTSNDFEEGN